MSDRPEAVRRSSGHSIDGGGDFSSPHNPQGAGGAGPTCIYHEGEQGVFRSHQGRFVLAAFADGERLVPREQVVFA